VITSPLLSNIRHRAMITPVRLQVLCVPRLWSRYSNFRLRFQHPEAFGSGSDSRTILSKKSEKNIVLLV